MADLKEEPVSDRISKGVQRIASKKKLTSQDLTVLLLHRRGISMSRMEKGIEHLEKGMGKLDMGVYRSDKLIGGIESGMDRIIGEVREVRREVVAVALLNQGRDIADIRAMMERIEAKLG